MRPLGFRSFWFDHSGRIRCRRRPKKTRQARADPSRCSFVGTPGRDFRHALPFPSPMSPARSHTIPSRPGLQAFGEHRSRPRRGFCRTRWVRAIDERPAAQTISPTAVLPALFRRALASAAGSTSCGALGGRGGAHGGRSASSGGGSCRGSRWSSRAQRRAQPRPAAPASDDSSAADSVKPNAAPRPSKESAFRRETSSLISTLVYASPALLPTWRPRYPPMPGSQRGWWRDALRLDPNYAAAHALLAMCHELSIGARGSARPTKPPGSGTRAVIVGRSDDATALAVAAFVITMLSKDHEAALSAVERALSLNASCATARYFGALIEAFFFATMDWSFAVCGSQGNAASPA